MLISSFWQSPLCIGASDLSLQIHDPIPATYILLLVKGHWNRIDAMPLIGWSWKSLSLKNMAEMAMAWCANNLNATAVSICIPLNCTWDGIKESRPSTTRVKLCSGSIQGCVTATTCIDSFFKMLVIDSSTRPFSSGLEWIWERELASSLGIKGRNRRHGQGSLKKMCHH